MKTKFGKNKKFTRTQNFSGKPESHNEPADFLAGFIADMKIKNAPRTVRYVRQVERYWLRRF